MCRFRSIFSPRHDLRGTPQSCFLWPVLGSITGNVNFSHLHSLISLSPSFVTVFHPLVHRRRDPNRLNDEAENSSSQIYWRSFLLRWLLLQRRVERILSPSLCTGSQGQFQMNLPLVAVARVKMATLSRTSIRPCGKVFI